MGRGARSEDLAARAPGGGRRGAGGGGARRPGHGWELVCRRRVGRALLPRPALHHEAGGRRLRAAGRTLTSCQHIPEIGQRRRRRSLVPIYYVLQLKTKYIICNFKLYIFIDTCIY